MSREPSSSSTASPAPAALRLPSALEERSPRGAVPHELPTDAQQTLIGALRRELDEERALVSELRSALVRASSAPITPSTRTVEAAAAAALRGAATATAATLSGAALEAHQGQREAAIGADAMRRELVQADAALLGAHAAADSSRTALQAAHAALVAEQQARATAEEQAAVAQRDAEEMAEQLVRGSEAAEAVALQLRAAEAEKRGAAAAALLEREKVQKELAAEAEARRTLLSRCDALQRDLDGTRAELAASKLALEAASTNARDEAASLHDEASAAATASADERAVLLTQVSLGRGRAEIAPRSDSPLDCPHPFPRQPIRPHAPSRRLAPLLPFACLGSWRRCTPSGARSTSGSSPSAPMPGRPDRSQK